MCLASITKAGRKKNLPRPLFKTVISRYKPFILCRQLGESVNLAQDSQGTIFYETAILLNLEDRAITRRMRAVSLDAPQNRQMTKLLRGVCIEILCSLI